MTRCFYLQFEQDSYLRQGLAIKKVVKVLTRSNKKQIHYNKNLFSLHIENTKIEEEKIDTLSTYRSGLLKQESKF